MPAPSARVDRMKTIHLALVLFGIALALSAYQCGRASVPAPIEASLPIAEIPMGSSPSPSSPIVPAPSDLSLPEEPREVLPDQVFSARLERRLFANQEHLVVGGFALPIPQDGPNRTYPMLTAIGLTNACRLDMDCPIFLFSRSMGAPEPASYYSPTKFEAVDLRGLTPEAWAKSQAAERHSILYPERAQTHVNSHGVTITELITDMLEGQGVYYLLTRPDQSVGILIFDHSGVGEALAEGARKVE